MSAEGQGSETPPEAGDGGNAIGEAEARIAELEAQVAELAARVEAAESSQTAQAQGSGIPGTAAAQGPVAAEKDPNPDLDIGQAEVQERVDQINDVGYLGGTPDPTPNEHYSMETPPDAPTPETDPELAAEAQRILVGNPLTHTTNPSVAGGEAGPGATEKS